MDADETGRVMVRGKNGTVLLPVGTSSVSSPVIVSCAIGFDIPLCIITGLPSKSDPLPTLESALSFDSIGINVLCCCFDCSDEDATAPTGAALSVASFFSSSVSFFPISSMFRFITMRSGIAMLMSIPAAEIFARRT